MKYLVSPDGVVHEAVVSSAGVTPRRGPPRKQGDVWSRRTLCELLWRDQWTVSDLRVLARSEVTCLYCLAAG